MKKIKYYVDEMPSDPSECPHAEWEPYPPFIEEPGHWICKLGGECKIGEHRCKHLIEKDYHGD